MSEKIKEAGMKRGLCGVRVGVHSSCVLLDDGEPHKFLNSVLSKCQRETERRANFTKEIR